MNEAIRARVEKVKAARAALMEFLKGSASMRAWQEISQKLTDAEHELCTLVIEALDEEVQS